MAGKRALRARHARKSPALLRRLHALQLVVGALNLPRERRVRQAKTISGSASVRRVDARSSLIARVQGPVVLVGGLEDESPHVRGRAEDVDGPRRAVQDDDVVAGAHRLLDDLEPAPLSGAARSLSGERPVFWDENALQRSTP